MNQSQEEKLITLDTELPIWNQFYTVAPLVVIGTKEGDAYDLAPKHMATPLGRENYFGFVCTPRHSTYHNVKKEKAFTVSFPRPDQVILTSLAAWPRCGFENKMASERWHFHAARTRSIPDHPWDYLTFFRRCRRYFSKNNKNCVDNTVKIV